MEWTKHTSGSIVKLDLLNIGPGRGNEDAMLEDYVLAIEKLMH